MKTLLSPSPAQSALRPLFRPAALLAALALAALLPAQTSVPQSRRIAIFGSSVASGTGDETGREGYAGYLRGLLAPSGWDVVNQSRGGDNTVTAAPRFAAGGRPKGRKPFRGCQQPSLPGSCRPRPTCSVQVAVLPVLGALQRHLQGDAVLRELVDLDAGHDSDRAGDGGALVVGLRGGVGLPAEVPALVDELGELGLAK